MSKKKLFILVLFVLLCFPTIAYASVVCSTPVISGGGSSSASSGAGGGSDCGDAVCVSTYSSNYVGVRIQIYKYTGSGSYSDVELVGKGVDIWATDSLNKSTYHFSKPNTSNLKTKASCTTAKLESRKSYGTNLKSIYSLSSSQYLSGDYGTVTYDTTIKTRYNNGTLNTYLLSSNYKSGWIYTNLLSKLISNTTSSRSDLKSLFGLTDTQIDDILSNGSDYYIYAEMLYRFWINTKSSDNRTTYVNSYGAVVDNYYLGTASEGGQLHGYIDIYKGLYLQKGLTVGKLVNDSVTSSNSYLIKTVSSFSGTYFNNWSAQSGSLNAYAACNSGYGVNIWNLSVVCEECSPPSCSDDCSAYAVGSVERAVCAKAWCSSDNNEGDYDTCVSACSKPDPSEGCDDEYSNTCATYTDSSGNKTSSTKSATCSSNTSKETSDVTLSTRTCFDAETTITGDSDSSETSTEYYSLTGIKYYKIECYETEKLTELPGKQNVYVSSTGSASLYLGYTKTYTKTCTLYYLNSSSDGWTTDYSKSKLKADITSYGKIKDGTISGSNLDSDTKKAMQSEATTIYNELSKVKSRALARLKLVTAASYKVSGSSAADTATIVYATSSTTTSTDTVSMTPVYCFNTVNTDNKYCTLESNKWSKTSTSDIWCTDNASDGVVKVSDNEYTTSTTIYYSVPSSYLAVYSNKIGSAYRSLSACKKATGSEDNCNEVEYAYAFSKITMPLSTYNSVIGNKAFTLKITGDGMCSQFEYNLTCDYDLKDDDDTSNTCDDYCSTNVVCRAKYCPDECYGCDKKESDDCPDDTCVKKYCSDYKGDEYTKCKYDTCCSAECNGNSACVYRCCTSKCEELYTSDDDIASCKAECECPNGICEDEYYYRTISRSDPFLTSTGTHVTGANWKGNETYITEASGESDDTNDTTNYEYKITLSSSNISAIKNQTTYNTVYSDYSISKYASSVTSTNSDVDEYCSAFIYDYLYTSLGVKIEKSSLVGSKGCEVK